MPQRIRISAGSLIMHAELNDCATAQAIYAILPVQGVARTWGDEIYFSIPVDQKLEPGAVEIVEVGDLGYWPSGKAFCVFFGPTPASRGEEIRPASAVNPVGKVLGDARRFEAVRDGDLVVLEVDS